MNKHGQSTIEYILIAVLVILGVVVMGPYVLRSVDAHFKLWDDGIKDSFQENITQAPISDMPPINAKCSCTTHDGGCGSSAVGAPCGAGQHCYSLDCTPSNCIPTNNGSQQRSWSVPDDKCCTTYYKRGCGTNPIPTPDATNDAQSIQGETTCSSTSGLPSGAYCLLPPAGGCYYGQSLWATQCSDLPGTCVTDPDCNPSCWGTPPANALPCPDSTTYLSQSVPYGALVANATSCTGKKCQMYCPDTYILNADGTACLAPNTTSSSTAPTCSGFSGTWTGNYTDACGLHADNNNYDNAYGDLFISFQCVNNSLAGINSYYDANNSNSQNDNQTYRGINTNPPLNHVSTSATPVYCAFPWDGGGGYQTIYYENGNDSSCYDSIDSRGTSSGYLPPASCNPGGDQSKIISACSTHSYTITCNNYELVSIMSNSNPLPAQTLPYGCNWDGSSGQISDFGSGNDMSITCKNGIITDFQFTPKT